MVSTFDKEVLWSSWTSDFLVCYVKVFHVLLFLVQIASSLAFVSLYLALERPGPHLKYCSPISSLHSFDQLSLIRVLCLPNSSCNWFSGLSCSTWKHIWLRGSYFLATLSKNVGNLCSSKYLSLDSFLLLDFTDFVVFCLLFLSEGDSISSHKW